MVCEKTYQGERKMNIAMITDFPPYTGLGGYAFSVYDEFVKRKKPVEMVYLEHKNQFDFGKRKVKAVATPYNLPILSKTFNSYFYFPKHLPKGYDLYHVANQFIARCAAYRQPSIVTCLDIIPVMRKSDHPFSVWFLLDMAMKHIKKAERVIAISEHTKKDLMGYIKISPKKIDVIPLGYDSGIFRPMSRAKAREKLGLPKDKTIVLNVGSGEKRKNIPTLMKAFSIFKKSFPDAMLIRIGNEDKENKRIAREAGLIGDIMYDHIKDKNKLAMMYNAADLFVFPSLYEGFGMPPLEAIACGIPTVVADATSLPEVVGKGAAIIKPMDAEGYAKAMSRLMDDSAYRRGIIARGRKQARKFEWKGIAKDTWRVYEEVLG